MSAALPAPGGAPGGQRLLLGAIAASVLVHAGLLALRFAAPGGGQATAHTDPRLDVVLVNARGTRKPGMPQALAQADLDGGGDAERGRRSSPLPSLAAGPAGASGEALRRAVEQLEQEQRELLVRQREEQAALARALQSAPAPVRESRHAREELARMEAEIAREVNEYQKRPRVHRLQPSTASVPWARYFEQWRARVERIGNEHYPEEARGRIYGSLRMTVVIERDGALREIVIEESSGSPVPDAAARRIVTLASPFPPFPPELSQDTDRLEITRTWNFTHDELALRNNQ